MKHGFAPAIHSDSLMRHLLCITLLGGSALAELKPEFIFTTAPFPSSHASTVIELKNGDILSAWFGGTAEGKPDVAIWAARRTESGWSAPFEVVREPKIPSYNPVLFYTKDQHLWLYYKFGVHPSSWTAGRLWSGDDGQTWSKPEHLPAGLYGPIRAKPLVMADGTIVSGTSVESYRSWAAWIERSTDNGKSWTKFGPITVAPKTGETAVRATLRRRCRDRTNGTSPRELSSLRSYRSAAATSGFTRARLHGPGKYASRIPPMPA